MMSLNPEVQKKAQAEIDAVVGKGKLPEFTDRTGLPYVNALCKEVFRIHTIVPTGAALSILPLYNRYLTSSDRFAPRIDGG